MNSPFSLAGKNILVTGASSGIGRALAIECSLQGAAVTISGRNSDRLAETLELLFKGPDHQCFIADLDVDEEVYALADSLSRLDGLILNAGLIKSMPAKFTKREHIDQIFNVNFYSTALLVQRLLKGRKLNTGASICLISSVASQYVSVGNTIYSASKGAVNSYTKALALELSSKQIRVNAILPGFVNTNLLSDSHVTAEELAVHEGKYPIGRFGTPQDVAYLGVYLLSDASSWMTGSLLTLDGGFSLR
ncbi:SDR family NAD(P)-dependent oxidoreductase [Lewinella sp. LCG006]|uniref:SDR family NAD(P)-dependent oxidoreductase n=1 Tax=Lewinella sp. LCG006 TaxID=3231911 RepID=UPI00345F2CBA